MLLCSGEGVDFVQMNVDGYATATAVITRYGRNRLERNERVCHLGSTGDIEDENHFVLICNIYNDLRTKYTNIYYRRSPSVAKFIDLLNSDNVSTKNVLCVPCISLRKHAY